MGEHEPAPRQNRGRRRRRACIAELRRQLGPLEYTLVVLIVVGIAITIGMAILDPSS